MLSVEYRCAFDVDIMQLKGAVNAITVLCFGF